LFFGRSNGSESISLEAGTSFPAEESATADLEDNSGASGNKSA